MSNQSSVGIADMKLARTQGILVTYALGSCIGICLYDPVIKLAAMIHIMLPNRMEHSSDNVFKYADTGIEITLRKMEAFGAIRGRIVSKIAGGAKMFDTPSIGNIGSIGQRNIISVRQILRSYGIPILKEDVGSNYARTLFFDASTGKGLIRSYGKPEVII